MNAHGFFRAAKAAGINVDGVVMSGGALQFTDVPQERQDALRALLASYDSTKADEQDRIDAEIRAIEATARDDRTLRAAILGDPVALAKLQAVEDAIKPKRDQRPK